jgi:hypothetical protein
MLVLIRPPDCQLVPRSRTLQCIKRYYKYAGVISGRGLGIVSFASSQARNQSRFLWKGMGLSTRVRVQALIWSRVSNPSAVGMEFRREGQLSCVSCYRLHRGFVCGFSSRMSSDHRQSANCATSVTPAVEYIIMSTKALVMRYYDCLEVTTESLRTCL